MRARTLVAVGLALAAAACPRPPPKTAYRHGRVRFLEPGVTLQRATEVSAEEAVVNLPFLPGDRVWTDSAGRAEFQFPDGTVVRLDRRSKLDYSAHEEGQEQRIVLRLWSGSALVRVRTRDFARFEIETPAGMVRILDRGIVRADVDSGELRLSVYAGEAELDDGRQPVRLAAGERTFARWGAPAEEPRRFDPAEEAGDDFARWDDLRESEDRRASRSSEYLPASSTPTPASSSGTASGSTRRRPASCGCPASRGLAPVLERPVDVDGLRLDLGAVRELGLGPLPLRALGRLRVVRLVLDARPRLGPGLGELGGGRRLRRLVPARPARPAGPALALRPRPLGPRGGYGSRRRLERRAPGRPRASRRRAPALRGRGPAVDPDAVRVADSPLFRPTRDGRQLRAGDARAFAISRRQTPGDFVRELGVDNKTTIPAPWTRGYGPPPAGRAGPGTGHSGATARSGTRTTRQRAATPARRPRTPRRPRPAPSYAPTVPTRGGESNRAEGSQTGRRRSVDRSGSSERRSPSRLWETLSRRREATPSERTGGYRPRSGASAARRPRASAGRLRAATVLAATAGRRRAATPGRRCTPAAADSGARARPSGGDGGGSRSGDRGGAAPEQPDRSRRRPQGPSGPPRLAARSPAGHNRCDGGAARPDPAPRRGDGAVRGRHPRRRARRGLLRLRERPAAGHVARGFPAEHHHPGLRRRRQRARRVRDREAGGGRVPGHPARPAQRDRRGRGRGLLEAHRDQPVADPGGGAREPALGPPGAGLLDPDHAADAPALPHPREDLRAQDQGGASSPSRSRRTSRRRRSSPSTATRSTSATATTGWRRRAASSSASR